MLSQRHRLQLDENPNALVKQRKRHQSNWKPRGYGLGLGTSHGDRSYDSWLVAEDWGVAFVGRLTPVF